LSLDFKVLTPQIKYHSPPPKFNGILHNSSYPNIVDYGKIVVVYWLTINKVYNLMFIEDNVYVFGCQFQFIIIIIIVIIVIILLCGHAVVRCIEMKV